MFSMNTAMALYVFGVYQNVKKTYMLKVWSWIGDKCTSWKEKKEEKEKIASI